MCWQAQEPTANDPPLNLTLLVLIITGALHFPDRTIKACRLFENPYTGDGSGQDQLLYKSYRFQGMMSSRHMNVGCRMPWKQVIGRLTATLQCCNNPVFKTEGEAGMPQLQWRQGRILHFCPSEMGFSALTHSLKLFFPPQYAYNHKEIQG